MFIEFQYSFLDDHMNPEPNSFEDIKPEIIFPPLLKTTSASPVIHVFSTEVSSEGSSTILSTSSNFWPPLKTDILQETLEPEILTTVVNFPEKITDSIMTVQKNRTESSLSVENEVTTQMTFQKFPSNIETVTIVTTSTISTSSKPPTTISILENEKKILSINTTSERSITSTFKPKLSPDTIPGYLMLFFRSSLADVCQTSSTLRENLIQFMMERSLKLVLLLIFEVT